MRRTVATELMDDPLVDAAELDENFADIELANRWFGGVAPVARGVFAADAASVLDVACGSGDIALALLRDPRGRALRVTGLDSSDAVLAIARRRLGHAAVELVRGDATALPFPDGAFDVATCNLALHHFEPADAVLVLRELRRVARAPLVCDLARSRAGHAAARLFAGVLARNRLTKHDGPLSVLRAYTPAEALALAREAGWRAPRVRPSAFFRYVLDDAAPRGRPAAARLGTASP